MRINIFNIANEQRIQEKSDTNKSYLHSYIAVLEEKLYRRKSIVLEDNTNLEESKYKTFLSSVLQQLTIIETKASSLNHDKGKPVEVECGTSFAEFKSGEDIIAYMEKRHEVSVKAQEIQTDIVIANYKAVAALLVKAAESSSFDNCSELIGKLESTYLTPSVADITFTKVREDEVSTTYVCRELFGNYQLQHIVKKYTPLRINNILDIQPVEVVQKNKPSTPESTSTVVFNNMETVTKFIAAIKTYIGEEIEYDNSSLITKQTNEENKFYATLNEALHSMQAHPLNADKHNNVKQAIDFILESHAQGKKFIPENITQAFDEKFLKETTDMLMKLTETYFWNS